MKTVAIWTLALLAIVGIGVGVEAAVGVGRPASTPSMGVVTGIFEAVGGMAPGRPRGVEGSVYLIAVTATCIDPTDQLCHVAAVGTSGADGRFTITAPAGNYFLAGSMNGGSFLTTDGLNYVLVKAGETVHGEVVVEEK
jgi:hypothetical protein